MDAMNVPINMQPGKLENEKFPLQEGGGRSSGMSVPMQDVHARTIQPGIPAANETFNLNCPPGLEYLTLIDQLLVCQKKELLEVFTGFETNNKYAILNGQGQPVYYAMEENDFCTRLCLGKLRPFEMRILDNAKREVIHISRPFACMDCCWPCWLQKMEVSAPVGNPIGYIEQEWSCCSPKFRILNTSHETVLRIQGPVVTCSCCADVDFQVLSVDGQTEVGKISKQWSGFAKELFTDADNFGVQFPVDLSVEMKATVLAATFLIDFMYFEHQHKQNN